MKHFPNADFVDVADGAAFEVGENVHAFRVPKHRFRKGNTYALSRPEGVILIDAIHQVTAAALNKHLAGRKVLAVLLTHSDLVQQAFGPPKLLSHCFNNAPVLIHSADATAADLTHLEAAGELLESLGISYFHIPGHTPGSVLYRTEPEQLLFAGDGVIGRRYGSNPEEESASHAPIDDADWEGFVEGWASVLPPIEAVLPLHGEMMFGPESLVEARAAATLRANVMQ